MKSLKNQTVLGLLATAVSAVLLAPIATASSHREAPFITQHPKVDAADFYMFRSYETGREGYVTLIANYVPLQDAGGGPNYFAMDPSAVYEIHIDNNGDAVEDLTFQFDFNNTLGNAGAGLALSIDGVDVAVPLANIGQFGNGDNSGVQNVIQNYTLNVIQGDRRSGTSTTVGTYEKPMDNIGAKSFPDYNGYVASISNSVGAFNDATASVCPAGAQDIRVFAGQRRESFAVNLGEIFDLVNLDPTAATNSQSNDLLNKNITTLAVEVPIACLTNSGAVDVIAAWTTASLPQVRVLDPTPSATSAEVTAGPMVQVSRLGMPLVNEVVIGLPDKDRFNSSEPKDDAQFATYVTNPSLPVLLNVLFGVTPPSNAGRADLVAAFLTGIDGVNKTAAVAEMQRLNVTIAAAAKGAQNNLGVIGGDNAGFPNGRRPGDDVVDIELRVAMGILCHALPGVFCDAVDAASGTINYTDGAVQDDSQFDAVFPYLTTPVAGSPN
ncbi:MAG: DUF4331 domain-containing protein [Gammaproteobacteria bacterium]|nr:DUF4331 domain-containing protein [Gammaproteobacteria bacterium]